MDESIGGLASLKDEMPDALFIPSIQREKTAVLEANRTGIPVIGICDSNANPERVQYVIPGNDDAVKSIDMIVNLVKDAIVKGAKEYESKKTIDKKTNKPARKAQVVSESI